MRKKNGQGREYYLKYGNLLFEGEYKDGLRHGKGKEFYFDKMIYEGKYVFGNRAK